MGGGLFQDVVYYGLGRAAIGSDKVRAIATRTRLLRDGLGPIQAAWRDRMFATLLASKFAYGLYAPILITAGMAKAPFWRFLGESMSLSALVLAAWLGAGYGLGRAYGGLGHDADWVTAGLGVLGIAGLVFVARYARSHLAQGKPA
jgi:membrane protein DedA with SNARE-associated domain